MAEGTFPKSDGNILYASEVNAFVPPGTVVAWLKTFGAADSGNTDDIGATTDILKDTGQNFQTTVKVGYIVHNTTDDTFANVTAITSDTELALDADIMDDSEDYIIYKTTKLPDGWVECNGQALDDAGSIYNDETIPDLNASSGTARFLRGATSSGGTGGTETHTHGKLGSGSFYSGTTAGIDATSTLPSYYEVVWIMRVK